MSLQKLFVIIGCITLATIGHAQHKRAFMVGISRYDTELTGYEWNDIHGKEDVLLLSPILRKQGFVVTSILDDKATHKNIMQSLDKFISSTKKGDVVYLHFSCHGQPFEDKNGDEADGWDESLVPIDAYKKFKKGEYEGEKHIIDDQLNALTDKIRKKIGKKGLLYVAIDACHAGTSSRGSDEIVRGTMTAFSSDKTKIYNPPAEKKTNYKIETNDQMSNVVFLEACRADQVNKEIKVDGKPYGALSYNIALTLQRCSLSVTPQQFITSLKESMKIAGRWPNNQNMVIETSF